GRIVTPVFSDVSFEMERARHLAGIFQAGLDFHYRDVGKRSGSESDRTVGPMAETTLLAFLRSLGLEMTALAPPGDKTIPPPDLAAVAERQKRQVSELEHHLQGLIDTSRSERDEYLWKTPITTPEAWDAAMAPYRKTFREE